MDRRFEGNVILVAGGTGALGCAVSRAFLNEGATVIVTYRQEEQFNMLRNSILGGSSRLAAYRVDVTNEADVLGMATSIITLHQRLDALINTVGGYAGGARLWELETKVLDQMLDLNLRSAYTTSRAVLPTMLKQGRGSIVNVAAKAAVDNPGGAAAYAASKAAALAMVNSLAVDVAGTGVRVNTVLPSIIDTPENRRTMPQADFAKWPKTDDIARVILFLCTTDATVIHGAAIPVYGDR